jgi:hypothetical protein
MCTTAEVSASRAMRRSPKTAMASASAFRAATVRERPYAHLLTRVARLPRAGGLGQCSIGVLGGHVAVEGGSEGAGRGRGPPGHRGRHLWEGAGRRRVDEPPREPRGQGDALPSRDRQGAAIRPLANARGSVDAPGWARASRRSRVKRRGRGATPMRPLRMSSQTSGVFSSEKRLPMSFGARPTQHTSSLSPRERAGVRAPGMGPAPVRGPLTLTLSRGEREKTRVARKRHVWLAARGSWLVAYVRHLRHLPA